MRAVTILLFVLISIRLDADTHSVVKSKFAGHESVYGRYEKGQNFRFEAIHAEQSRESITIYNFDQKKTYVLDVPAREYYEVPPPQTDWVSSLAQFISKPVRSRDSGKVVNIYYETIDTGERKQFFGRTARHLLLKERDVAEPGACQASRQLERDGWYIPQTERSHRSSAYLIGTGYLCHDTVVKHGNLQSPGTPVLETSGESTFEVLELTDEPLNASLFIVPADFKKVDRPHGAQPVSWWQQIESDWMQLERAVQSWFV